MLVSGSVEVYKRVLPGRGQLLASIHAPTVIGEMGLLTTHRAAASVVAKSRVEAYGIPKDRFLQLLDADSPAACKVVYEIGRTLAGRMAATDESISRSSRERVPPDGPPEGYWDLAPDLVVEVVSPNDSASEVQSKVQMWLEAGVRLVWVVYPEVRSVVTYVSLKKISALTAADTLSGGDVVPGFECPVAGIFE